MVPGVCCPLSRPLPRSSIMSSQIHRDYLPLGSMQWSASRDKCKESVFSSLVCYGNRSRLDMRAQCIRESGSDDARTSVSTDEGKETARQSSRENINGHVKTTDESLSAAMVEVAEKVVEAAAQKVSTVGEIEALSTEALVLDQPTAIKTVVFWVTAAVAFGAFVGITEGSTKASEFFAGYLLEQSLSVDNLFVFVLIFKYFQVPVPYQGRVLAYGIAGAIVFRATMILLGIATVQRFEAVNLLFAGVLLFSSYKLLSESEDDEVDLSSNYVVNACKRYIPVSSDYDGNNFFTVVDGAKKATPLLLTLAVIELSDIAFAVDSIPAVFGVTRDPFIVLSSNLFAILGLRSLYTLISSSMAELEYLQPSVAIILGFIGGKMVLDFFGFHVPTEASLVIVAATLGTGVCLSLLLPSSDDESKRD